MLYIVLSAIYAHLYISLFYVMQIKLSHHPVHILSLIFSGHNDPYFALHSLQFIQHLQHSNSHNKFDEVSHIVDHLIFQNGLSQSESVWSIHGG